MGDISAELTLRLARFIQMPETPPASPARWFFVPEFHSAPWDEACALLAASGADETVIDVVSFRRWLTEYAVCVGSTLQRQAPAPHAAGLIIRRPHGGWSPGMACDVPAPAS